MPITRYDIIGCLWDCQRLAAEVNGWREVDRIGTREIELVNGDARNGWRLIKKLRSEGLLKRSSGFCWLTREGRREALRLRLERTVGIGLPDFVERILDEIEAKLYVTLIAEDPEGALGL